MKISNIEGIIRRRILVNYRVKPEFIQPLLPAKFRPKLHEGFAIAGICLIRLEHVRLRGVPGILGISSENAAHRFAVLWSDARGAVQEGVYISRRDTNSRINQIAGGRLFPGEHHAAQFKIADDGERIDFDMRSKNDEVVVKIRARTAKELPSGSKFSDTATASAFFEPGSLGYSATRKGDRLEGLRLKTSTWKIAPLQVEHLQSSFFDNQARLPAGSIAFDCALLMRDIHHEWRSETDLYI